LIPPIMPMVFNRDSRLQAGPARMEPQNKDLRSYKCKAGEYQSELWITINVGRIKCEKQSNIHRLQEDKRAGRQPYGKIALAHLLH
ncbi:MAG: hypothetical protein AAGI28_11935, partial [Pseudomonadota bacterium]